MLVELAVADQAHRFAGLPVQCRPQATEHLLRKRVLAAAVAARFWAVAVPVQAKDKVRLA